ncbi:hypothetical protein FB446DRAFT_699428 [Lentinula raphanica]|nr:hypothetical protein FB446DRAFT_699428 [Lentinula raphanica]
MAAVADRLRVLGQGVLSSRLWDPNGPALFDLTRDSSTRSTREEVKTKFILILCIVISAGTLIFCIGSLLYHLVVFAYSWIYDRIPATRFIELNRLEKEFEQRREELKHREEEVELKEARIAQEARSVEMDVEIGVCKRFVDILQPLVTNTEVRKVELEQDKERQLQEISRLRNREALDG